MPSGWSGEMGISSPVPSRLGFVMERKSQTGDCGTALHGCAIMGRLWAHLKHKTGVWPPLKPLEITGELPFSGIWEARNLNACRLPEPDTKTH